MKQLDVTILFEICPTSKRIIPRLKVNDPYLLPRGKNQFYVEISRLHLSRSWIG